MRDIPAAGLELGKVTLDTPCALCRGIGDNPQVDPIIEGEPIAVINWAYSGWRCNSRHSRSFRLGGVGISYTNLR